MFVKIFPKTSLDNKPHKMTPQERIKELMDEIGIKATLDALSDELARRCMEDTTRESKRAFAVMQATKEEVLC